MLSKSYKLSGKVWLYPGAAAWYFVYINAEVSREIREKYKKVRRGFGSFPVTVKSGKTTWKTSIFPTKEGPYLLPLKAKVRRDEGIFDGDTVTFLLTILK